MSDWITNVTLLQRVKNQHDDQSWEEFNEYYRPYIYMITKGLNMQHDDAKEITQLIMIKIWKNLPKFDYDPDKGYFRGWLRTVTVNMVRNYIASKAFKQESLESIQESNESLPDLDRDFSKSEIERIADEEWEVYICRLAWDNVKENFEENAQEVYRLLSEGKECDVIGEQLGIKRNTVYVYRKRIQEKLYREIRRLNHELG
ncbi:sigma-70 family RNA polymerase sigma factor [Lentisphaera profundi]|uniref:RNA polymerase sigma factor SigS n=1 Tax=Lentisphaera profundi TaxID=1658616 RepID=A0ABY7VT85_9BACT|nr:sigma-70 family RNA polymerase sigma factor [Lentisphaera profundi]WDE97413.1 sigma-70 family RNA polymerase sigma factor [Lentisphaera profundi]